MMENIHFTLLSALLLIACLVAANTVPSRPESKCVYLKNVLYDEYLYTEPLISAYDEYPNVQQVFAWSRKADDPTNWGITKGNDYKYQAVFLLEKTNPTCQECLTIKSAYSKDAGVLFSFIMIGPARFTATFGGNDPFPIDLGQNVWEMEHVPGQFNRIRLKNKSPGEEVIQYLYAGTQKPDDDRRAVYMQSEKEDSKIDSWQGAANWITSDVECPSYLF